jgi:flagellar motor switch protein FliG
MAKKKDEPIQINGAKMASELLAGLDPSMRNRILGEIRQKDPGLAEKLKKGLVSFDRVIALEPADLQKVLRACPQNLIALALRGLDEASKKTVLSKMTERQAGALLEEMQLMGPQKQSDVLQARERICETARALAESGVVSL